MIDLGSLVQIAVDVRDATGALTNPQGATLTITLPDGTTATPTVTLPPSSTGKLRVDYTPAQEGRYSWRMVTTSPATAYSDVFDVVTVLGSLVSLADAKKHLNMDATATDDDDELRLFIASATAMMEDYIGKAMARQSYTQYVTFEQPVSEFLLEMIPVISLTTIGRVDNTDTWQTTDFNLDNESGHLMVKPGSNSLVGQVKFVYTAGEVVVEHRHRLAALITLKHLWDTQRGVMGVQLGGENEYAQMPYGPAFSLPNRAKELLGNPMPGIG